MFRNAGLLVAQAALSASVYLEQGIFEMKVGKYETAVESFTRIIEEESSVEIPYILRSQCLCK